MSPGIDLLPGYLVALSHLMRETGSLAETARHLMLGRPGPDEELLSIVELFEERNLRR